MTKISQDDVKKWIVKIEGKRNCEEPCGKKIGSQGPDLIIKDVRLKYYVETIAFSVRKNKRGNVVGTGKNQSDFWKAFAQAVSRLNPDSKWGKADRIVVALPMEYRNGWDARTMIYGEDIWKRIGTIFPELQIWFVSKKKIIELSWNDSYNWEVT